MESLDNLEIKQKITNLAKKYNLDLLILFGSRATNTHKRNSDFDIAFLKSNITIKQEMDLFDNLMSILKFEKIDLINISTNHDVKVRLEIFQNGKPLYERKKGLFTILKGKVWIDYQDFQRFTKNRAEILARSIQKLNI